MRLPLIGPSYASRSVAAAAQQTMNLYPEVVEVPGEKNKLVLYGTPGYSLLKNTALIDAGITGIRGVWGCTKPDGTGGRLFIAAKAGYYTKIFEVNEAGNLVGAVHTINGGPAGSLADPPVQMMGNGDQLFIISGGYAYLDNGAGPVLCRFQLASDCNTNGTAVTWAGNAGEDTFQPEMVGRYITIDGNNYLVTAWTDDTHITIGSTAGIQNGVAWTCDGGEPVTAVSGAFLDGYFIVQRPTNPADQLQGRQINICALRNGLSWDPLDKTYKEGSPDYLSRILADHQELYMLGTETIEVFRDTGNNDFPLERVPGMFIHLGNMAPFGAVSMNGKLYFLGGDSRGGMVAYRLEGGTPVRVSTHDQERTWADPNAIPVPVATNSFPYTEEGHFFWLVAVPGCMAWVYDASTDMWHERGKWNADHWDPIPYQVHTFIPEWGASGQHIVGDWNSGKICIQSLDLYDDLGDDIKRRRALAHIYQENKRLFCSRVEIEMETGVPENGTPAPVIELDFSDDRGHTFGTPRTGSMGAAGEYTNRVFWNRCGSFRDRVPRLTITGKRKVALIDASAEIQAGLS